MLELRASLSKENRETLRRLLELSTNAKKSGIGPKPTKKAKP